MDDLPPENATGSAPPAYGAASGRSGVDYNVPPPAYGGAAGVGGGGGAMPPPYSSAASAHPPAYGYGGSTAPPSSAAAPPSYYSAAPSAPSGAPTPSAPAGYGAAPQQRHQQQPPATGAPAPRGPPAGYGGVSSLPGPSAGDVMCVACRRRLRPPPGAPVFACPCGQRMQAPPPAAGTPPSGYPGAAAAAAAAGGAAGGGAAAGPGFVTLPRPVVAACPTCSSHVHAATNPCRCGGCGNVFTIDMADPLRLRSAPRRKKNFLSYMFTGD